ncbi:hypothetical protein TWF173_011204 [Orbilia oligospora]|nr:hypothetical protein TWF173_011204 [Orbilia oligospora]
MLINRVDIFPGHLQFPISTSLYSCAPWAAIAKTGLVIVKHHHTDITLAFAQKETTGNLQRWEMPLLRIFDQAVRCFTAAKPLLPAGTINFLLRSGCTYPIESKMTP